MTSIFWTDQARDDLAGIDRFISQDSAYYAQIVVARLIAATERLAIFPRSGRVVPEWKTDDVREVIHSSYRVIYRLFADNQIHILTVHHGARALPPKDEISPGG